DGEFFLNAKDVCMIEYIPNLVEAGIDAFKIEGRMREADYVETVTRCYREALDAYYAGEYTVERVDAWLSQLKLAFNRGFSTGFYFQRPTDRDISKVRGNVSPIHREEIGQVMSYFPASGAAKIQVTHGQLKVGDEITVDGINTDTHFKQIIQEIKFGPINVDHTPLVKSSDQKLVVEIVMLQPVMKNDRVYKYLPRKVANS
ncbi:MAG TPA: U32 family peptidase, partial [Candidatus Lokiarchaeia archaeon]|nr:U32 family peptidase [Candidatus Lokiarchaeia archaeon]